MRRVLSHPLRQFVVLTIASVFASCSDQTGPTQAPTTTFRTPTGLVTTNPPEIILTAGDISDCGNNNDEATAQILDANPVFPVYILGDNVYENGTTSEFNNCYHPTWGRHKDRTKASAGNHEYNTSGATPYYNYFGAAAGPAGLGYFSYEQGAWHIIVLNSNISMGSSSAQGQWLAADLAAHPNLCSLAYFHHPLYSSTGGSGSGGVTYSGVRPLYDQLYAAGVDVILAGHRHFYERMAKMKPDGSADDVRGVREFIVGTGGKSGGSVTNVFPRSEVRNGVTYGVMKMYLYDDSYAWKFLPIAGRTFSDSGSTACHTSTGGGGGGVSASQSTVAASPASFTAGSGSSTITVTVRDASGIPISGANVVVSATGSGNTLTPNSGSTDGSGVFTSTLTSTGAESKTVSATANGIGITQTAPVTVTAGPVSGTVSTVTASPTSFVAGAGSSTITVTARDANGNTISGLAVVLGATGSGNILSPSSGSTNSSGVFTSTLTSTVAEPKAVSATIAGVAVTPSASVNVTTSGGGGGTIAQALLTSGSNAANQSVYTTATISPAANALVTVAVRSRRSGGPLTPTLSGGGMTTWTQVATVDYHTVGSPLARLAVFRALSAAPGSGPLTITFSNSVSNAEWIVSQWTGVDESGTNGSGAIGQIGSARGDAVSTLSVPLAAFGSANNVALGLVGAAVNSGVNPGAGFAEIAETSSGETTVLEGEWAVNSNTISASWPASNAALLGIEIKAGGGGDGPTVSPSLSTVAASPASIASGGETSTITVTARDGSGNPMSGANVVLAATGSGNTLTGGGLTNGSGVATGTLSSTVAGDKIVSATINGVAITQTDTVTVNPPGPTVSASLSTVVAAPTSFTAGGSSTITITVNDGSGTPMSGINVTLSAIGSGNITQPSSPTDGSGQTTGSFTSTGAGSKTITAVAGGVTLDQKPIVTVTAGPADGGQSTVVAAPTSITAGSGSSTITVTVKDAFGNPVGNSAVALSAPGTNVTLGNPSGPANPSGVFTSSLSSTDPQTVNVSATADLVPISQSATVTVTPPGSGGTITHGLLTSGHDFNNLRIYTTASIAPAPNSLVTVAVLTHQSAAAAPSPTLTGGGMGAWEIVASVAYNGATPLDRLTIYRAMSPTPGSGPITITSSVTVSNCQWIVSQWGGVETSGANGAGAIVQTGSTSGTVVNGLTVPLASFASASNVAYGAFGVASATAVVTAGSGFTTIDQQPSGESTVGDLFAEWAVNLNAINATWTSKSAGALGVEIRAATGP